MYLPKFTASREILMKFCVIKILLYVVHWYDYMINMVRRYTRVSDIIDVECMSIKLWHVYHMNVTTDTLINDW